MGNNPWCELVEVMVASDVGRRTGWRLYECTHRQTLRPCAVPRQWGHPLPLSTLHFSVLCAGHPHPPSKLLCLAYCRQHPQSDKQEGRQCWLHHRTHPHAQKGEGPVQCSCASGQPSDLGVSPPTHGQRRMMLTRGVTTLKLGDPFTPGLGCIGHRSCFGCVLAL